MLSKSASSLRPAALAIIVFAGFCGAASVSFGQRPYGMCPPGMEGCAPRRHTFGYYETTWRQWPVQKPTPAATQQPESVPTPAPAEPQRAEPQRERETTPRGEEGGETERPRPSTEPPSSLFEDMPTAPPQESTPEPAMPTMPSAPAEPSPLEGLPTLPPPSTSAPAGGEDAPPRMPDDDPFKDDPPELPKNSEREPRPRMLGTTTPPGTIDHANAARARLTPKVARPEFELPEASAAPVASQPKLLPAAEDAAPRFEPAAAVRPVRNNALRESTSNTNVAQVVSAAHWTRTQDAVTTHAPQRRVNPLRDQK